jgi:hypothetical protein
MTSENGRKTPSAWLANVLALIQRDIRNRRTAAQEAQRAARYNEQGVNMVRVTLTGPIRNGKHTVKMRKVRWIMTNLDNHVEVCSPCRLSREVPNTYISRLMVIFLLIVNSCDVSQTSMECTNSVLEPPYYYRPSTPGMAVWADGIGLCETYSKRKCDRQGGAMGQSLQHQMHHVW